MSWQSWTRFCWSSSSSGQEIRAIKLLMKPSVCLIEALDGVCTLLKRVTDLLSLDVGRVCRCRAQVLPGLTEQWTSIGNPIKSRVMLPDLKLAVG